MIFWEWSLDKGVTASEFFFKIVGVTPLNLRLSLSFKVYRFNDIQMPSIKTACIDLLNILRSSLHGRLDKPILSVKKRL